MNLLMSANKLSSRTIPLSTWEHLPVTADNRQGQKFPHRY